MHLELGDRLRPLVAEARRSVIALVLKLHPSP